MATATQKTFVADDLGTKRLVAAPGDDIPSGAAPRPPYIEQGPDQYDSTPSYDELIGGTAPVAAGSDFTRSLRPVRVGGTVVGVTYIPDATITGAATNNRTLSLVNKKQDGTGTTVIATLSFGNGTNAPANDEKVIPLSGTAANLTVAAGDVLALQSVHVGTGIADPGGVVRVEVDPA